jgi:chromosome segregation ATPase
MNHFHKRIERVREELRLVQESRGDVMVGLVTHPEDEELLAQLGKLDEDIRRRNEELARLQDAATAFERQDKAAIATAKAKEHDTACKAYRTELRAMEALAPKIDKTIDDLIAYFSEYEQRVNTALGAGRRADLNTQRLRHVLSLNPLGVRLADALARNGWSKLPFIEVANPRTATSLTDMVVKCCDRARVEFEYVKSKK